MIDEKLQRLRFLLIGYQKDQNVIVKDYYNTLFEIFHSEGYWELSQNIDGHLLYTLEKVNKFLPLYIEKLKEISSLLNNNLINQEVSLIHKINILSLDMVDSGKKIDEFKNLFKEWKSLKLNNNLELISEQVLKLERSISLKQRMKISKKNNPLYHAVSTERALGILNQNALEIRSTHHYWRDGLRRNNPRIEGYKEHDVVKGICFSRCFQFAIKFNTVVLVVNGDKLRNKYKMLPLSWFNSDHKKEKEEFLFYKTILNIKNPELLENFTNEELELIRRSEGQIELNEDIFNGFYINPDRYAKINEILELMKHPKFLGFCS